MTGAMVLLPDGAYGITGRVTISGNGSLLGSGHGFVKTAGPPVSYSAKTTIRCLTAGAGVDVVGGDGGEIANFLIDGNGIATLPFQGLLSGSGSTANGAFKLIRNVSVINSAQDNVTWMGRQNDMFVNCLFGSAARDNLYLDKGAGGNMFVACEGVSPGRYDIHLDVLVSGGLFNQPSYNKWVGGRSEGYGTTTSQIYLRSDFATTFGGGFAVTGQANGGGDSGPVIDASGSILLDLGQCGVTSNLTTGGATPGHIGLQAAGVTGLILPQFYGGDTSWYAPSASTNVSFPSGIDLTANGFVAASGMNDPWTMTKGAVGPWRTLALTAPAVALVGGQAPRYRWTGTGDVELDGDVQGAASGTAVFTLPAGYRPAQTKQPVIYVSGGYGVLAIGTNGQATPFSFAGTIGSGFYMDGISYPTG